MAENIETLTYRLNRLEAEVANAELEIGDLEKQMRAAKAEAARQIQAIKDEVDARERGHFKAGIIFLGGLVATLFGVIWSNLGQIMPGR